MNKSAPISELCCGHEVEHPRERPLTERDAERVERRRTPACEKEAVR